MKRLKLVLRPRDIVSNAPLDPDLLQQLKEKAQAAIPPNPPTPPTDVASGGDDDEEEVPLVPDEQLETKVREHVGARLDERDAQLKQRAERAGHTPAAQLELEEIADQIRSDNTEREKNLAGQKLDSAVRSVVELSKTALTEGAKEGFRVLIRALIEMF